jgi:hypothetical protein
VRYQTVYLSVTSTTDDSFMLCLMWVAGFHISYVLDNLDVILRLIHSGSVNGNLNEMDSIQGSFHIRCPHAAYQIISTPLVFASSNASGPNFSNSSADIGGFGICLKAGVTAPWRR